MPDHPNNSTDTSSLPEYIAHYRILRRLGKGGMGEVFLGEDTRQHGRKVALKVLPHELTKSESRLPRFKQEARAMARVNHPNVIRILDVIGLALALDLHGVHEHVAHRHHVAAAREHHGRGAWRVRLR